MNKFKFAGAGALMVALVAAGESFKVYPGAVTYTSPDTEEAREAKRTLPHGTTSTIDTTNDSYEKVVEFSAELNFEVIWY